MELTKDKLLHLWRMRQTIFNDRRNQRLLGRFGWLEEMFGQILGTEVLYEGGEGSRRVFVNGRPVVMADGQSPNDSYFACEEDKMAAQGALVGVKKMAKSLPDFRKEIMNIGYLLGGFDHEGSESMVEEYRIISNTIKEGHDRRSLVSSGRSRHPSSNFADNNYFFNVIDAIKAIESGDFDPAESRLVLRYPHDTYYGPHDAPDFLERTIADQRQALARRFPYKFFYAWTHRYKALHLIGLKAYRELLRQKDFLYPADGAMDQPYDQFIGDEGWTAYSNKIRNLIPLDEQGEDFMAEMSKLLSVVLSMPVDLKNMLELLDTGSHAIVLWGPPGTGKTYSAKTLVCQKLGIGADRLDDHKFTNGGDYAQGAWDIVQFHPNYAYEDFIGGISPRLDGDTLAYTLKTGIFKRMCDAANRPENREKPFVLIVDEINRADLSAVFGELMYALEYRGEPVTIPNFEEPFVIPSNVYLIGTMNSVDKSLATFDLALRRRFGFYKIMPAPSLLPTMLADANLPGDSLEAFVKRCEELNDQIAHNRILQLGDDYQIGHAYFAKIKDFIGANEQEHNIATFELEKLWVYHLEPLLEEYVGNRLDDPEVRRVVNELKDKFIESL